jgi:hypothetical protein
MSSFSSLKAYFLSLSFNFGLLTGQTEMTGRPKTSASADLSSTMVWPYSDSPARARIFPVRSGKQLKIVNFAISNTEY